MAYGIARGPPVDDADLTAFITTISSLPTEEWRSRISALKSLVDSIPDYSTTPFDESTGEYVNNDSDVLDLSTTPSSSSSRRGGGNGNGNGGGNGAKTIPWYRSYKSVRHLARPLATLLLDARSAVVKDATELIGTLLAVKLQPHPSLTRDDDDDVVVVDQKEEEEGGEGNHDEKNESNGGLETINGESLLFDDGGASKKEKQQQQQQRPNHATHRPPPAFVGRLLLKDLLPSILDLSRQTVKTIRTYGVNMMTVDVLPHCRVKSCIVVLLERMKVHANRTVREDSARYLRCILETWPSWDDSNNDNDNGGNGSGNGVSNANNNDGMGIVNSRKEERLSLDSARQIGLGLGRTLSDSAKPVREEAKRGFEALFRRFRKVWDEVMSSGVVRDVRLRKKLLEAAGGSGNIFDDATSLGELSLNSAVSAMSLASNRSHMSHRSYASRGMANNNNGGGGNGGIGVPSMIGTPKTSPGTGGGGRLRHGYSPPTSSPGYMRGTGASAVRTALTLMGDVDGIAVREPSAKYSTKKYVTSSGHVISTPSPSSSRRRATTSSAYGGGGGGSGGRTPQQPFASLLQTPARHEDHHRGHQHRSTFVPIAMAESSSDRGRSCKEDPSSRGEDLKRRLSRRISGIPGAGESAEAEAPSSAARDRCRSPSHLTSIDEAEDGNDIGSAAAAPAVAGEEEGVSQSSEIANVAMEVIAAHLFHLERAGALIAKEREMLSDLAKRLGVPPGSITDGTNAAGLTSRIAVAMSEGDVCDYFESVHACADEQREACESLLGEMERISEGGGGGGAVNASAGVGGVGSPAMGSHLGRELAQSPMASDLALTQRDLEGQFIASS